MNPRIVLGFFLIIMIIGCRPCKDHTNPECPNYCINEADPQCPNYDPCLSKQPTRSLFMMGQDFPGGILDFLSWKFLDADTVSGPIVRFEALAEDASYEWRIGAGIYTDQILTLRFDEVQKQNPGQTIPITLIVSKTPDLSCFPDDDGKDTLTRYLTIMDKCSTRLRGDFSGHWLGIPEETFVISIDLRSEERYTGCTDVQYLSNFDNDDCIMRQTAGARGYDQVAFGHGNLNTCEGAVSHLVKGLAWVSGPSRDSLNLDYIVDNDHFVDGDERFLQFRGIRVK